MTLRHYLNAATATLAHAGVDAPRLSAQVLTAHALGCTKLDLALRAEGELSPQDAAAAEALVRRRAGGEPVAYIVGRRDFYGRDFAVTPATLIPRPETEEMVESALRLCTGQQARFVDLGTGSGCIAVTLAAERPQWQGIMLDKSPAALEVAARNAQTLGVGERVLAVRADLCCPPLACAPAGSFDCVISNPPYVSATEMDTLSPEVRDFEPHSALTPEHTGLAHIAAIAGYAWQLLRPGGHCLLEHGHAQGQAALALFCAAGAWQECRVLRDMAGLDRYICCRK